MIKIGILGSTGRVGSLLIDDLENDNEARVAAVHVFDKLTRNLPADTIVTNDMKVLFDSSDVIIDFSAPSATEALLTEVVENSGNKPLVIATTGFNKHQQNLLLEAIFYDRYSTEDSFRNKLKGYVLQEIIYNDELRKKYQWANTQAAYSQGSLMGQLAVKVCYTKGADWVDELVEYIYENVKYMSRYVKENFPKAKMVEPEGTYLVWVDFSGYGFSNEELEHLMLEEAKLWLDSGIIFGPETAHFERFNVACPRVTVEQALTQLKNALDKHLAEK